MLLKDVTRRDSLRKTARKAVDCAERVCLAEQNSDVELDTLIRVSVNSGQSLDDLVKWSRS